MADDRSIRILRDGNEKETGMTRILHAGPVSVTLENGTLRYIRVGDVELVRQIYVAIRDRNWDTIPPRFIKEEISSTDRSFIVRFTVEHEDGHINFIWDGMISGTEDGRIRFEMQGYARESFLKNRIGFSILHPMELAGSEVTILTQEGQQAGRFPVEISPHQPFVNMTGLSYSVNGTEVELKFEGDIFEMEDQRNWTDASYKTYCTPLGLPFPVRVSLGDVITQAVELKVSSPTQQGTVVSKESATIIVSDQVQGSIPEIGLVDGATKMLDEHEKILLRQLRLGHLRVEVDLSESNYREQIDLCRTNAESLRSHIDIEVLLNDPQELSSLLSYLSSTSTPVRRIFLFDKSTHVSNDSLLRFAKNLVSKTDLELQIGGGSRAFFTELNRSALSGNVLDVIAYPVNPQVHAFDNESVMETLQAQGVTVKTTHKRFGNSPIVVGPITLRMRFNPNATNMRAVQSSEKLETDPRQKSLFGAAWTLGSIASLSYMGVAAITYYRLTGPAGVMDGQVFPLFHVLADVAEVRGGTLLNCSCDDSNLSVLALKDKSHTRILIANLSGRIKRASVEVPKSNRVRLRYLDETNAGAAMHSPERYRDQASYHEVGSSFSIELLPYATACIDLI